MRKPITIFNSRLMSIFKTIIKEKINNGYIKNPDDLMNVINTNMQVIESREAFRNFNVDNITCVDMDINAYNVYLKIRYNEIGSIDTQIFNLRFYLK